MLIFSSSNSSISGIDCINSKLCSANVSVENCAVNDECEILNSTEVQVQNDTHSKQDKDKCVNANSESEKAIKTVHESSYLSAKIEEMIYRNKTVLEDQHQEVSKNRKHDLEKIIPWIQILFFWIDQNVNILLNFTQMNLMFCLSS